MDIDIKQTTETEPRKSMLTPTLTQQTHPNS